MNQRNIEREPKMDRNAREELARLEARIEPPIEREPKNYRNLGEVMDATRGKGREIRMLQSVVRNERSGAAEREAALEKLPGAESDATKLLIRIDLARAANEITTRAERDPDLSPLVPDMPQVYQPRAA